MIRLVIMDVEGVIVLPGGSQYPWPMQEMFAVRRFFEGSSEAGALCTGRQQPYGEAVVQALGLFRPLPDAVRARVREESGHEILSWPSIMENGAYFYDPIAKQPIRHPGITSERLQMIRRLRDEVLPPIVEATRAQVEIAKEFSVSLNPALVDRSTGERGSTVELRSTVEAALGDLATEVEVKHSLSAVDITLRGVSKASAVQLLMDWTGLAPDEVLGVGDSLADEAWLTVVGHRAAPANGRDALRELDYCSPLPVAKGLLDILERMVGGRRDPVWV